MEPVLKFLRKAVCDTDGADSTVVASSAPVRTLSSLAIIQDAELTGYGPAILCQFLRSVTERLGTRNHHPLLYVACAHPVAHLVSGLQVAIETPARKPFPLRVLDCHSPAATSTTNSTRHAFLTCNPVSPSSSSLSLVDIERGLQQLLPTASRAFVVFDSLDALFVSNTPGQVLRWLCSLQKQGLVPLLAGLYEPDDVLRRHCRASVQLQALPARHAVHLAAVSSVLHKGSLRSKAAATREYLVWLRQRFLELATVPLTHAAPCDIEPTEDKSDPSVKVHSRRTVRGGPAQAAPDVDSTFNIETTAKQAAARANVQLPYVHQGSRPASQRAGVHGDLLQVISSVVDQAPLGTDFDSDSDSGDDLDDDLDI